MSERITRVAGRVVVIEGDDIDTDRIVPARFLRCVTFDGLGETLFRDERVDSSGTSRAHALDAPGASGAAIMLTGRNFGCGSSREHAPQAIVRAGFRAVVAEGFAEIFAANSLALGLVLATVSAADAQRLRTALDSNPEGQMRIDLESMRIDVGTESVSCTMPADARTALVEGRWDPLSELLGAAAATGQTMSLLPYLRWTHP